ncbi:WD40-repeat-containing domain protein [Sphaerosporella brunnea]|uniref:WD40-repeat-containing domain protein n=1 Tax=Sphaerosporella brunnea TaxID=1250544 RepID=A0A5J5EVB3_9PEZI|nr:WD40-repeat-containing domain protein [Sphaerosporella brunnea]
MPFPGIGHGHARSQSSATPDQPLASLVQAASQTLTGIGNPAAVGATTTTTTNNNNNNNNTTGTTSTKHRPANNPNQGLRVQTNTGFVSASSSQQNSGITPIHSGGSSAIVSPNSSDPPPPKKTISFRLPSPNTQATGSRPPQQQQQQQQQQPRQSQELYQSPVDIQRPGDQKLQLSDSRQSYTAYHATNPSSNTGARPQISNSSTAPGAVPQASQQQQQQRPSMHRTNTGGNNSGYSSNPSLATGDVGGSRKHTHPGALTPTHPTSQHTPSHLHSAANHLSGLGLTGLSNSSNSMRDREEAVGATAPGKWMCGYGLYAIDWCKWPPSTGGNSGYGRVAVGSYTEDSHNYIQVLDTRPGPADPSQPGAPTLEFTKLAEASHTYPITRVLWEPPSSKPLTDLLATSGDHLRLWSLPSPGSSAPTPNSNSITARSYQGQTQKLTPLALLSNSKSTDFTAPLTSLDWNQVSPSLIITSSIDTTCTIWDIPTLTAKTQLIAHDKEVFDVRFMSNSVDVFASCGADGSVRMFDLRSLEHSTIIYEPGTTKSSSSSGDGGSPVNNGAPPALLRLAASPHDQHLIATFCIDSPVVRILDVRQPGQALVELKGHTANINCCEWNPGRRGVLAAGGDDCEVLVWDVFGAAGAGPSGSIKTEKGVELERTPIAWWGCETEVNNISWSPSVGKSGSDWIGVVGGRGVYGLAV